jgi:hypothetical protein
LLEADTGKICKEWSSYLDFSQTYDLVYEQMDQVRVLEALEEPVWMNLAVEIVLSAFGEKVSKIVKHADYLCSLMKLETTPV